MKKQLFFLLFAFGAFVSCETEKLQIPADIIFTDGTVTTPSFGTGQLSETLKFSSTQPWTATVEAGKSWCTVSPSSGDAGTENILTISVLENETNEGRTAKVIITSDGMSKEITATQDPAGVFLLTGVPTEPVASTENSFVITVNENIGLPEVKIAENVDWVTYKVVPTSKDMTTTQLSFTVKANKTYDARSTDITIISGGKEKTFTITQNPNDKFSFTGVPTDPVSASENTFVITITNSSGATNVKIADGIDWMTYKINTPSPSTTETKVTFTVQANTIFDARSGDVTITIGDSAPEKFTVTQKQLSSFTLEGVPTESFSPAENSFNVTVSENIGAPTVDIPSEVDWITYEVVPAVKGISETLLKFKLSVNLSGAKRSSAITVICGGEENLFTITQLEGDTFKVTGIPTESIVASANTFEVTVVENTGAPEVSIANGVDWITYELVSQSKAISTTTFKFTVKENTTHGVRSGGVTIKSGTTQSKIFTVTQKQLDSFTITGMPTLPFTAAANSFEVIASANTGTPTVTILEGSSWITYKVTPAVKGLSTTKITFSISENTTLGDRKANIKIASGTKHESFNVVQLPGSVFEFNGAPKAPITSAESTFVISVAENTGTPTIEIANGVNWMTYKVTPAAKGVTETQFTFTVKENPTDTPRTGNVTIKSGSEVPKTFSVTQNKKLLGVIDNLDPKFKQYLLSRNGVVGGDPLNVKVDTNGDNIISYEEASVITHINCNYKSIPSLAGIEHFIQLTHLDCRNNLLTNVDVSKNVALVRLDCRDNQLTSLNTSTNAALTYLNCTNNALPKIDITNNRKLEELYCIGNMLSDINTINNTVLEFFSCSGNKLTALDLSTNKELRVVYCKANELVNINITNSPKLLSLYCYDNKLTDINVSKNTQMTDFDCKRNRLVNIDVSKNVELKVLNCNPMNDAAGSNLLNQIKKLAGQKISITKPSAATIIEV